MLQWDPDKGDRGMGEILICDHDGVEADRLRRLLIKEGYRVEVVNQLKELLFKIGNESYQTVILAMNVEPNGGVESIPLINQVEEDLPIIIIVEKDSLEFQRRIRKERIFYYVVKPINPREIKAVVKGAITKSKKRGNYGLPGERR